jgi:tripartite-type tricarboxylate transporter receptor subunit TctC
MIKKIFKNIKNKLLAVILIIMCNIVYAYQHVEIVIPFAPGGTTDKLALVILNPLKIELSNVGMLLTLTYKPGAAGIIGSNYVANSPQTRILIGPNAIVTSPIVNTQAATGNVETDLLPIAFVGHLPMWLVTNSHSNLRSLDDLRRECQHRNITYGSAGTGSATHIATAILLDNFGCLSTHIPYKGAMPALIDLQGNHILLASDFEASIRPFIDAKVFRPLLIFARNRSTVFPEVPSMSDIGITNYDFYNWFIIAVNSSAPAGDVANIQAAMQKVMSDQTVQHQLYKLGFRNTGQRITSLFLAEESAKFKKIINKININGLP